MSDQWKEFYNKNGTVFEISRVQEKDIPAILDCMDRVYAELTEKSWFSMDDHKDLIRYMTDSGFALQAKVPTDHGQGEVAAVFVARTSDLGAENLGTYLNLEDTQLPLVAHMEIAMVNSAYRGNSLQKKLMETAEEQLKRSGFLWLMGTAHPDNIYSVYNFQRLGYKIITKALKYGGLPRYIFCKRIGDF